MKVIIALDSFKGSCSATQACAAVARGIKTSYRKLKRWSYRFQTEEKG